MKFYLILVLILPFLLCCEETAQKKSMSQMLDVSFDQQRQPDQILDQWIKDQSIDQAVLDQALLLPKSGIDGLFEVQALLDGHPIENALITQGGTAFSYFTDAQGKLMLYLDPWVAGQLMVIATHPQSRTVAIEVSGDRQEPLVIELKSYQASLDSTYRIADPGEPSHRNSTAQCGHCHLSNNDAWFLSPHRSSAKNEIVYDLLMGRGYGWQDQSACQQAGGQWKISRIPGQDELKEQCFFEISAFKAYNEDCDQNPCDRPSQFGGCADCHAPAIDQKGHQNLLDARGIAYEYGVSCDICHRVDQVRMDEPAGVAGRLLLSKPLERASVTLGAGGLLPLTFGPNPDVPNPRMGISQRDHFKNGLICAGCHLHIHHSLESRFNADESRWPDHRIPNQSTYQEWEDSPYFEAVPCNECHMPAVADMANGANLEKFPSADIGIQAGWPRGMGETREHAWWGPRQKAGKMLELASDLKIKLLDQSIGQTPNQSQIHLSLMVGNIGAGHALPTGEPMRHLIALISLFCQGEEIPQSAGDLVHQIGGYAEIKVKNEGFTHWDKAEVGDQIRVIAFDDEFYDYDGVHDFKKEGRFTAAQKGLQKESLIGVFEITAVNADGQVSLNQEPQGGDIAYLIKSQPQYPQYAGLPGFSFARVMSNEQYQPHKQLVPHFIATDIKRDNRLKPMQKWESQHAFIVPDACLSTGLKAQAKLIYRPYPLWLAQERGWDLGDQVIQEAELDIQLIP